MEEKSKALRKLTVLCDQNMVETIEAYKKLSGKWHPLYPIKIGLGMLHVAMKARGEGKRLALVDKDNNVTDIISV